MNKELALRIRLENPLAGVDFSLQKGSGTNCQLLQKQRSVSQDLVFECLITVKSDADSQPDFAGTVVQGARGNRFIYINIGKSAGQLDSVWSRRLKIPLQGITTEMIEQTANSSTLILETSVPATGKDGGPTCGTVKPFNGWDIAKKSCQSTIPARE